MVHDTITDLTRADDGFEAFYAEKIWALIPGIYRLEDSRSVTPGALRALVEVMAGQAAVERRSVDRLWRDSQIDDCDDRAIPYIARLLATRLVSEQNPAGRRADVANTIRYRRRAGTLQLLAKLADDIAGWDAAAPEAWKRLIRFAHLLDCPAPPGRVTRSPQFGLPDLRAARAREIHDTAWDEFSHFPDFRRLAGRKGRYNLPKVNLHVYRQYANLIRNGTPHRFDDTHWTFDPSGRDVPLFKPGDPFIGDCRAGAEWQLRGPLSCGLLNDARYSPNPAAAAASIGAGLLVVADQVFRSANALVARAEHIAGVPLTAAQGRDLLDLSILPDSARVALIPDAVALAIGNDPDADTLARAEIAGGDLSVWETLSPVPRPWVRAVIDPATGRLWLDAAPAAGDALYTLRHHHGSFGPVGAGSYARRARLGTDAPNALPDPVPPLADPGPIADFDLPGTPDVAAPPGAGDYQLADSRTYLHRAAPGLVASDTLRIQAADGTRPYLRLPLDPGPPVGRWEIDTTLPGSSITLDGLWLGLFPDGHGPAPDPAPPVTTHLAIVGNFESVTLRHMTLDPGGSRSRIAAGLTEVIPSVTLLLEGAIDRLVIENCITGPIEERLTAGTHCTANEICIFDSIVQNTLRGPAILTRYSDLQIARSTIFGDVSAARFRIDDSIVQGTLAAQDPQGSCVRYTAAIETAAAGIPNAYRCVPFEGVMPNHVFLSRRFGDPGFGQLSETAPDTIRRGAESTSEMGVFHDQIDAIKRDDLTLKLAEFCPVNVIPQLIFET